MSFQAGQQRFIIATCEKGTVEETADIKDIKAGRDEARKKYPKLIQIAS